MCKVLEIEPGVHNGSLEIIQSVLITDQSKYKTSRNHLYLENLIFNFNNMICF